MTRLKLLLAMVAMTALMICTVALFSPYAPVVSPVTDIEAIWAIEDARTESDSPLVTALENHGVPLAYDAQTNTFYCTLGLGHEEAWPEIHLTAPGVGKINLVFADDYSYDSCSEAIQEGYAYQILTYTDDAYFYTQIVFTGLPIVVMNTDDEIGETDTLVEVAICKYGDEPLTSKANVHRRGGGSLNAEKAGYRVEFIRSGEGKKNIVEIPELGLRSNMILSGMYADEQMVRDRLCWQIYGELLGEEYNSGFGARKTAYAELFLNNEYRGVYLMMEPMDAEEELREAGDSHLLTDSVYRSVRVWFLDERPTIQNPVKENSKFELRYEPDGAEMFSAMQGYIDLLIEEDDERFKEKVAQRMDVHSVALYGLLEQAMALSDNVHNNLYFWVTKTPDGMRYRLVPWDMDMSWGQKADDLGSQFENWLDYPLLDRMVALNAGGVADLMVECWKDWRKTVFTQEHIEEVLRGYMTELSASGAMQRNAQRWSLFNEESDYMEIVWFAGLRFQAIDCAMEQIENRGDGVPAFLKDIGLGMESYPIYDVNIGTDGDEW